jgi:phthalate 4,5-dioxygenase oxygenase subunit
VGEMLTREQNERLTRVSPGTPMGELMRRYWIPALLSEEIAEPDSPPVRVRLLCEDLVAFRDSNGKVGLLAEKCAHRRASLFYGRNEEGGLRCIYHGWKYDADGRIIDTPAEPAESMIKHHVRQAAYPCREINGVIWTYMGPKDLEPPLPDYPWITLPRDHVDVGCKIYLENNWMQGLEGDCDSVHSAYLHRRRRQDATNDASSADQARRNAPEQDIDVSGWGVRAITKYPLDDDQISIRTNSFVMPCVGNTPRGRGEVNEGIHVVHYVPSDDYNTWRYDWEVFWDRTTDGAYGRAQRNEVTADFRKLRNLRNDFLIDREKQRSGELYCGIEAGNHTQDAAVTETMGPICDRENEHLGQSDTHIAAVRRYLLDAMDQMEAGHEPPGIFRNPDENKIGNFLHMLTAIIPRSGDWRELLPKS